MGKMNDIVDTTYAFKKSTYWTRLVQYASQITVAKRKRNIWGVIFLLSVATYIGLGYVTIIAPTSTEDLSWYIMVIPITFASLIPIPTHLYMQNVMRIRRLQANVRWTENAIRDFDL